MTCTNCFESFAHRDVDFQCKSCGEVYAGDLSWSGALSAPECPECELIARAVQCPECHEPLPPGALSADNRIVAVLGAPGAGKSHYITTLYKQMRNKVGPSQKLAMMIMDESRERFERDYEKPLYKDHVLIDRTARVSLARETKDPLKFEVARSLSNTKRRSLHLSFFDTAGEDLGETEIMVRELRYIAAADAIVFILDPLQLEPVRNLLAPRGVILPGIDSAASPSLISRRVHEILVSQGKVNAGRKIATPVAFALSKVDELFPLIDSGSPVRRSGLHRGGLDQKEIDSVHTEIVTYLGEWGASLQNDIDIYYQNYRFFGVSALGEPHNKDLTVDNISPIRVEDPLLWILNKFGMVEKI